MGDETSAPFRKVLNRINDRAEFRNSFLHGHFIRSGGPEGQLGQGKIGQSIKDILQGLEPIHADTLKSETQLIAEIIKELGNYRADFAKPKS
jgi:hypothetical protein